jgi:hypothetical protein
MLSAVDSGSGINYVIGATYGPDSALTGFISGQGGTFPGIVNSFSYNKRLQPSMISAFTGSQMVLNISYSYGEGNGTAGGFDNGNVLYIGNGKDHTRDQMFTYDLLNRLTSARNAGTDCTVNVLNGQKKFWGNSYTYDPWGNLLSKTVTNCSLGSAKHYRRCAEPPRRITPMTLPATCCMMPPTASITPGTRRTASPAPTALPIHMTTTATVFVSRMEIWLDSIGKGKEAAAIREDRKSV